MRKRARVDSNHQAVVRAFEKCGCAVVSLAQLGGGIPDLLVCIGRTAYLVEVKDGTRPPSERKLTPDQEKFHAGWRGTIFIVLDALQVLGLVNAIRKDAAR